MQKYLDMNESSYKILLVDDEPDILEYLEYNLKKEGYQIFSTNSGREAIDIAVRENPHLIILDVMMPYMDGIETCEEMRKTEALKNALIVFFTARGEDYSQVAGYDAGADDYITKPIKPKVLKSKVKALLKRYSTAEDGGDAINNKLEVGDLMIDRERFLVVYGENELILPKKEFELLILLASKPEKVFTRQEIYNTVWGNKFVVGERTIDVHIRKLREKLGENMIKTVKGVGYRLLE